ncbi:MAG: LamG domain-containing protein, partial [Limisphaerales bacterium]
MKRLAMVLAGIVVSLVAAVGSNAAAPLADKTLVAWVTPANLSQRGGSALTVEKGGGVFDAIVLGEIAPAKWMAGSDNFKRTNQKQDDLPAETAGPQTLVQIAVVYQGKQVTLYRNGIQVETYSVDNQESFGDDSFVVIGLRHLEAAAENRFFTGAIDDARIYGRALNRAEIAALQPNQSSNPPPLAWWDFENGLATDRMKAFPVTTLFG